MKLLIGIFIISIIYQFIRFSTEITILNITVTTNNINITNFQNIIKLFIGSTKCPPNSYSINAVQYNLTAPFTSPENKNDFSNIQLVFGPNQYFQPTFFKFTIGTVNNFPKAYIKDSFMDLPTRLNLMLTAVNNEVVNDTNKIVVFILNGSNVDPAQPWKSFNPMPYLSTFMGTINIQKYYNPGDGVKVCSGILSSGTITIAMDLSRSGALDVLNACNDRNLLNWRMRWLIFFSQLSYANINILGNISLRPNVSIYDFTQTNSFELTSVQTIAEEQDIVLSDIAFTAVKIMDAHNCTKDPGVIPLQLRTGLFNYNNGIVSRINWLLDIYRSNSKVGNATIYNGIVTVNQPPVGQLNSSMPNLIREMQAKPFRVAAMLEKPFAYYDTDNTTKIGYSVDIIKQILANLNVTYTLTFYNNSSGILSAGKLNGMLGIAQNGQADIVIGGITQNVNYQSFVDFTIPFLSDTVGILYKINASDPFSDIFEFINVFHLYVWILIVVSCIVYAVALTLVNLISPNQAKFSFRLSLLFTIGSMVQGVTTALPDKISGRILIVFWWIFNIAILLTYVANFGAILTNIRMQSAIVQLSDLYLQNAYSYASVRDSAVDYFLQTAASSDIQNVNQVIRSQYVNIIPNSTDAALFAVSNSTFAFIYGNAVLTKYIGQKCYVMVTGTDQFNYSFVLPLNSDYTNIFNAQLGSLHKTFIANLTNWYLSKPNVTDCQIANWIVPILNILGHEFIPNPLHALNINKTAGIFFIMIIGIFIAIVIGIIEIIVRKCRKKKD